MSVVTSHADYEARFPDEREYAEGIEQGRRSAYVLAHDGSDEGYRPGRNFPCPGLLRVIGQTQAHRVLLCDVCQFETTSKVDRRPVVVDPVKERADW